jgi:hypothetical protein
MGSPRKNGRLGDPLTFAEIRLTFGPMPSPNVAPNADERSSHSLQSRPRTFFSSVTSFFLFLFERITPDPYIFAIALTILTALLAVILAPKGSADMVLTGWYNGLFTILAFAFQMVLVLVTGYALSNSPPVRRLLDRLAGIATTPRRAVVVLVITVMVTSFINWGCGLVVAGLLAREIAKRIRIDFGWLVAAAVVTGSCERLRWPGSILENGCRPLSSGRCCGFRPLDVRLELDLPLSGP